MAQNYFLTSATQIYNPKFLRMAASCCCWSFINISTMKSVFKQIWDQLLKHTSVWNQEFISTGFYSNRILLIRKVQWKQSRLLEHINRFLQTNQHGRSLCRCLWSGCWEPRDSDGSATTWQLLRERTETSPLLTAAQHSKKLKKCAQGKCCNLKKLKGQHTGEGIVSACIDWWPWLDGNPAIFYFAHVHFAPRMTWSKTWSWVTTQVLGTSLGTHSSLPQDASNHAWLFELVSTALASSLGSEAAPALAWRTLGSCPTTATKGNRLHWWHFFKVSKETKKPFFSGSYWDSSLW